MSQPLIRQIVGRCHVNDSDRTVIRYVISRLRLGYATFRGMPPKQRRALLREVIATHRKNQALYLRAMRGRY